MNAHFDHPHPGDNPLLSESPTVWAQLIDSVNPASLLVVIESRMSAGLRARLASEDILQDALLHAWRDRKRLEWRGIKSFRSWLLSIIDNRIRDAADHAGARKRGEGRLPRPLHAETGSNVSDIPGPVYAALMETTTPSRLAMYREQAAAMHAALDSLPDDYRDVVRLRLFEQLTLEQVAVHLQIGVAAARHRFRKGAELYQVRLKNQLASRSRSNPDVKSS